MKAKSTIRREAQRLQRLSRCNKNISARDRHLAYDAAWALWWVLGVSNSPLNAVAEAVRAAEEAEKTDKA